MNPETLFYSFQVCRQCKCQQQAHRKPHSSFPLSFKAESELPLHYYLAHIDTYHRKKPHKLIPSQPTPPARSIYSPALIKYPQHDHVQLPSRSFDNMQDALTLTHTHGAREYSSPGRAPSQPTVSAHFILFFKCRSCSFHDTHVVRLNTYTNKQSQIISTFSSLEVVTCPVMLTTVAKLIDSPKG